MNILKTIFGHRNIKIKEYQDANLSEDKNTIVQGGKWLLNEWKMFK